MRIVNQLKTFKPKQFANYCVMASYALARGFSCNDALDWFSDGVDRSTIPEANLDCLQSSQCQPILKRIPVPLGTITSIWNFINWQAQ